MGNVGLPSSEELPLGLRFRPTDDEVIDYYLRRKINGRHREVACITEVDIYKFEPWDLSKLSAIKTKDKQWFFFCRRTANRSGQRLNRATQRGFWKTTGLDREIKSKRLGVIGMKKTLVFYTGRAPNGVHTNWVIHEYRTTLPELDGTHPGQEAFVVCRLFDKNDADEEVETPAVAPAANSPGHVSVGPLVAQASSSLQPTLEQPSHTLMQSNEASEEAAPPEVNSHLNEMYNYQGPSSIGPHSTTDISDELGGLVLPHVGGSEDPFGDFLNYVIKFPDDYVGDETASQGGQFVGSFSGSDVELPQLQPEVDFTNYTYIEQHVNPPLTSMDDEVFTDEALEQFLNESINWDHEEIDNTMSLPEVGQQQGVDSKGKGKQVDGDDGESAETGIKIRQRRSRNPGSSSAKSQGSANRRIRLQMLIQCHPSSEEVHYKMSGTDMISEKKVMSSYKGSKVYGYMMKVAMVVVLVIAMVVGMWNVRDVVVAALKLILVYPKLSLLKLWRNQ